MPRRSIFFDIVPLVNAIGGQLLPTDIANVHYSRYEEE
jgi:CRISPR/Cas system CMR subunit Cmr6 (Cas7 group RAMP superfamily)